MLQISFRKIFVRLMCSESSASINRTFKGRKESEAVVDRLIFEYGNEKLIRSFFSTNVHLEYLEYTLWKNFINTLQPYGFKLRDCLKIISRQPELIELNEKHIRTMVNEWKIKSTLEQDKLIYLLSTKPEFLNVNEKSLKLRIPYLLSYCTSKSYMVNLLLLCPNLMFECWDNVLSKINFLNDRVIVNRTEVLKCRALSKSLQHIALRFQVLQDCGFYTKPSPYPHKQTKKERLKLTNPHLRSITDTNDDEFATKVAKITLEEYEVYSEMFKLNSFHRVNINADGYGSDESDNA